MFQQNKNVCFLYLKIFQPKVGSVGAKLSVRAIVFSSARTSTLKFSLCSHWTHRFTKVNNPNVSVFTAKDGAIQKSKKTNFINFVLWELTFERLQIGNRWALPYEFFTAWLELKKSKLNSKGESLRWLPSEVSYFAWFL